MYVDGFIVPVPTANLDAYKKLAKLAGKVWMEHGAVAYHEWVADDVKPGKTTSFPQSVKLKDGETVIFSYIVYKSRAQRDKINAKVMADPRMKMMSPDQAPGDKKPMIFDGKRMIFGGFSSLVSY